VKLNRTHNALKNNFSKQIKKHVKNNSPLLCNV